MSFQKRVDSLHPHVVGARFTENIWVIDAVFNDNWEILASTDIGTVKSEESDNYYVFYSKKEGYGVDEVLDFIEKIINYNKEREAKYELLKVKVGELQELFDKTPLTKLKKLEFTFSSNTLVPEVMPKVVSEVPEVEKPSTLVDEPVKEEVPEPTREEPKKNSENKRGKVITAKNQDIELPPKGKVELEQYDAPDVVCKCGPDELCPACEEIKYPAES